MTVAIDLRQLILELIGDLKDKAPFDLNKNRDRYDEWLLAHGFHAFPALAEDAAFCASFAEKGFGPDGKLSRAQWLVWNAFTQLQANYPLPEKLTEYALWFYTMGVVMVKLWPVLSDRERVFVLALPEPWPEKIRDTIPVETPVTSFDERPFGVNLVGYVFGQLGIGEDVRMAGHAFLAAGVPMVMRDFKPGDHIPQNDHSMAAYVSADSPYQFNVFCMTAQENGRCYAKWGRREFAGRYNIGYWPWEIGSWPTEWVQMIDLVDEVWVSTWHTYDALSKVCNKPLKHMPMTVLLGEITDYGSRLAARLNFGLPASAQLFCFSFDLNSYIDRKNPQAVVDSFLQAFPRKAFDQSKVGLVIKTHKPRARDPVWEKLKQLAARDPRIHIFEESLQRPDLLALYQCCDCFVSLHRAEGFGRGLAEALQLGLHVITTGYSGNVDFCHPPYADLVSYKMIPISKGQYPYGAGRSWADPSVSDAARKMLAFVKNTPVNPVKTAWPEFSPEVVGTRYKERLLEIVAEQM